jgi:hypothetical protein
MFFDSLEFFLWKNHIDRTPQPGLQISVNAGQRPLPYPT